jgi:hypothetical protein
MFTLEIGGRAIAMTDADDSQARELFGSEDFKNDLRLLESEGRPLWDGSAPLDVRPSSEDEIEAFDDALEGNDDDSSAGLDGDADVDEFDDEEGIDVLFLVPVNTIEGASGAVH